MKIKEIKELNTLDVIAKNLTDNEELPIYEIYYVICNDKFNNEIVAYQGYFDYNKRRNILIEQSKNIIEYDELLLHFELIHKAGE